MATPIDYIRYWIYCAKRDFKRWWCIKFHNSRERVYGRLYWAVEGHHWVECTKCKQIHAEPNP